MMQRTNTWEISDAFWALVEPLIPCRERDPNKIYTRKPGGGRKPAAPRSIFTAILYVLRNGMIWNALPKEKFGVCSSTVHRAFLQWCDAGFFLALWRAGLAEFDEMEGIAWTWQSAGGCMVKAPLAIESVGKNPTDPGKTQDQASRACGRAWGPVVQHRDRG
jgi:transposase